MNIFMEKASVFADTYFFNPIKTVRILDIIDILLLGLIIYYVYLFIRERRAGKLLIGLGCVFLLLLIGDVLDMYAISYIFSDFSQLGVIAILILFQPELRSALEKVGGMPSSSIKNITNESKDASSRTADIEALCSAVSDMSRDKVGALIVIERSTKLGEYIKSGVAIDASISSHLVKNLFFNKAPLHDGAVILRGDRICAAGCFLPLSTNDEINKDLGTRHRAALGLSEISDAIVIVVSEETGIVSLAMDGHLTRNYNYSSLKQELNRLLAPSAQNDTQKKRRGGKKKKVKDSDDK